MIQDKKMNEKRKHSNGNIELTKKFKKQIFIQNVIKNLIIAFSVFIISLICFISFFSPIRDGLKFYIPSNKTAAIGDNVLVIDEEDSIINRFNNVIFGPTNLRYGVVIAGPNGIMYDESDGTSIVDNEGNTLNSNLKLENRDKFLKNEYIIKCTSGFCVKGEDEIVNKKQVKIIK